MMAEWMDKEKLRCGVTDLCELLGGYPKVFLVNFLSVNALHCRDTALTVEEPQNRDISRILLLEGLCHCISFSV